MKTNTAAAANDPVAHGEDTPAYAVLQAYGLLDTSYRKESFNDVFEPCDLTPNSSLEGNFWKRIMWGVYWTPGCGYLTYSAFNTEVVVPPGGICCFVDGSNNYIFAKPGVHNITDPFLQKVGEPMLVRDMVQPVHSMGGTRRQCPKVGSNDTIQHGNRTITIIPQGKLGFAMERGQPVLLPPGLHSWNKAHLQYERLYDLGRRVIEIGPYTILTVDEGYAAITQNNGCSQVLGGGATHLLSHAKWRFEKFITLKIQTDELQEAETASADNIIMSVTSQVVWQIRDVRLAATRAAETMAHAGQESISADISKLRRDVLKQAIASLALFIGSVNYSDSFHVAAAAQRSMESAQVANEAENRNGRKPSSTAAKVDGGAPNPMFNKAGMAEAVTNANIITSKFGVEIISISVVSANPVDKKLTASLATGAVASAEALQAETQARGMAKATKLEAEAAAVTRKIQADSEAIATMVKAQAEGDAERVRAEGAKAAEILRAQGSKQAAELIQGSEVAIQLETMKTSAAAIKHSDKFFFGQEPSYMPNVVMRGVTEDSPITADCLE